MKGLIFILVFFLSVSVGYAANSSVTTTVDYVSVGRAGDSMQTDCDIVVLKVVCVGDDSSGAISNTVLTPAASLRDKGCQGFYYEVGYWISEVWVEVPSGGTAPDAADLTIWDATSAALFDENALIPTSGTVAGTVDVLRAVTSALTIGVQNQATASADYTVYIKLIK